MNFEQWLKAVDAIFANKTGFHHDDFPDFLWMDEMGDDVWGDDDYDWR